MRINLSSNTDILAVTPTLFGFVPTNSIVAIVLDNIGDRHTVHVSARYDIAEPLDVAAQLAQHPSPATTRRGHAARSAHRHRRLRA